MRIKLYLDIDGVLLGKNPEGEILLIPYIEEFLLYTRENFDCYWLTTHSRHGREGALKYLEPYLKEHDLSLWNHIKAAAWQTLKTEVIDFDSPFIWIDDAPLNHEIEILKEKSCLKNWLHVDTYRNYCDLTIDLLEEKRNEILNR